AQSFLRTPAPRPSRVIIHQPLDGAFRRLARSRTRTGPVSQHGYDGFLPGLDGKGIVGGLAGGVRQAEAGGKHFHQMRAWATRPHVVGQRVLTNPSPMIAQKHSRANTVSPAR